MSSYMAKARNIKTDEVVDVACVDDYFGLHQYGYILQVDSKIMTQEQFSAEWKEIVS